MNSKTLTTSAMTVVFALTAFTPLVTHASFANGNRDGAILETVNANMDNLISQQELTTPIHKMSEIMAMEGFGDVSRLGWLFAGHMSDQH